MHPVCGIPELLEIMFSNLADESNTSNAQVCRQWSECALNVLWHDVMDFRRLFRILVPMKKEPTGAVMRYTFTRQAEVNDWKRFDRYRHRVRRLLCWIQPSPTCVIDLSVFEEVSRTRTSLNVFPNLRILTWDAPIWSGIVFMHDNVTDLRLYPCLMERGSPCFREIVARMPNITRLQLHMAFPTSLLAEELVQLVRGLRSLRHITLPREIPAAKFMEALSNLHALHTISFHYGHSPGFWSQENIPLRPSLNTGAFYSLSSLSICLHFEDAIYLFKMLSVPSQLRMICLDSPEIESPPKVHDLLVAVAKSAPDLKTLILWSSSDADGYTALPTSPENIIDIKTIRPLFNCRDIRCLDFLLRHTIYLNESDVEEVAKAWPSIQRLVLNHTPKHLHDGVLTLGSLLPFARHCPHLETLALFISADAVEPARSVLGPIMRRLHFFYPGSSDIGDPGIVSLSLSRIFPPGAQVLPYSVTEVNQNIPAPVMQIIQSRSEKWKMVSEMLPILMQARSEERQRMRSAMQSRYKSLD
ncbi:hypothetical protein Hypma_005428 [Hypsizygus marmoreus]|uniref:F-box domain-containing protein n=1 Tax=Hypsizygus marmoreus TaxID=39966 RepID=A0A369IZ79_HYPMA|nr:hypothetical protein Hypma_005428 [Hypsizygus marmoreus]